MKRLRIPGALLGALMLLSACSAKQPAAGAPSPLPTASVTAPASPTAQAPAVLFDGREPLKMAKATPEETALVTAEVKTRASEAFLKKRLEGLGDGPFEEQFQLIGTAEGSFSRDKASQKAVLYRYSYTNGVVVLEGDKVVAHYSGDPGDYALYQAIASAPDLNGNGRSELVLLRNVEDTAEIFAYLFDGQGPGLVFMGASTVFDSNVRPGEDPPAEEKDTAYLATGTAGMNLSRETFEKVGNGGWTSKGPSQSFTLDKEASLLPTLTRIDDSAKAEATPTVSPSTFGGGLPAFQEGDDYKSKVRVALFEAGWDPARSPEGDENCAGGGAYCQEYPELEAGPSSGAANAIFRWQRDGKILKVFTVGEPPVFQRIEE